MRVVSWNIHWGCGKDGRIRIHAIIDVLRKLNPDVICLQEVAANHPELEGSATANQFKQLAGAFGGFHPIEHAPSEIYRNNVPRLFGNLILSKYRITQAQRHMLPWPADPASRPGMPRGAIEVVLDTPGSQAAPGHHPPRIPLAAAAPGAGAAPARTACGDQRPRARVRGASGDGRAVSVRRAAGVGHLLRRLQHGARRRRLPGAAGAACRWRTAAGRCLGHPSRGAGACADHRAAWLSMAGDSPIATIISS